MNVVDVAGTLEVTSVAIGVAVVAQKLPECVEGTVVESTQVAQEDSEPMQGGVHSENELPDGKPCFSREIVGNSSPSLPTLVDNLDANDRIPRGSPSTLTTTSDVESRPSTPAEILNLPAQARLGNVYRRTVVDDNLFEKICLLLSFGYSNRQAAGYLGISPTTITNIAKRCPELAADFQQARDRKHMVPELTILAEASKNWRAAAWYLTHLAKNPRRLTEEEKEEQHQERLADQRRQAEISQQGMRDLAAQTRVFSEEQRKARDAERFGDVTARRKRKDARKK